MPQKDLSAAQILAVLNYNPSHERLRKYKRLERWLKNGKLSPNHKVEGKTLLDIVEEAQNKLFADLLKYHGARHSHELGAEEAQGGGSGTAPGSAEELEAEVGRRGEGEEEAEEAESKDERKPDEAEEEAPAASAPLTREDLRSRVSEAIEADDAEVLRPLLGEGVGLLSPNSVNDGNEPFVHVAARDNKPNALRCLLELGANPDQGYLGCSHTTPAYVAIQNTNEECLRHLLAYGANTEKQTGFDREPLSVVAQRRFGHPAWITLLKESGRGAETQSRHPDTALGAGAAEEVSVQQSGNLSRAIDRDTFEWMLERGRRNFQRYNFSGADLSGFDATRYGRLSLPHDFPFQGVQLRGFKMEEVHPEDSTEFWPIQYIDKIDCANSPMSAFMQLLNNVYLEKSVASNRTHSVNAQWIVGLQGRQQESLNSLWGAESSANNRNRIEVLMKLIACITTGDSFKKGLLFELAAPFVRSDAFDRGDFHRRLNSLARGSFNSLRKDFNERPNKYIQAIFTAPIENFTDELLRAEDTHSFLEEMERIVDLFQLGEGTRASGDFSDEESEGEGKGLEATADQPIAAAGAGVTGWRPRQEVHSQARNSNFWWVASEAREELEKQQEQEDNGTEMRALDRRGR